MKNELIHKSNKHFLILVLRDVIRTQRGNAQAGNYFLSCNKLQKSVIGSVSLLIDLKPIGWY